ncbi:MAG: Gfo/Idh/MocA family oxidoreductase [Bryobacteraceae bacterium]|nr:Gfo/Idh/MocA family oxidoreductase [Bryobacterales bacterium]MEB2362272.1 Gfo/Idh/MocA family oxidoreductase [Bryobacterales bacterium]NUM99484.1 Gfo/Idh/MocA family oxidoreductase [Bryobacteraceae bacterium]
MNRRNFIAATAISSSRVLAANEAIRGAIIGSGGRGRYLTANFKELGVEMAAVCDVYEPNLQAGLKIASSGAKPYGDYRRMLEDKSIDAVVIATPDHWHAQMTIDAVEAGKDVYVEKPMAHSIEEGFRMVDAVRRTNRIVQVGMQRRSFDLFLEGKQIVDSGTLGEVRLVNSWWLNHWTSLRTPPLQGKLDWEQFLGPAPKRPFDPVRYFNWLHFWDYSGGIMVGQAAHVVDAIQWFMNSTYPTAVTCAAGKPNVEGAEIPETVSMAAEFPENYLAVFTLGYKAMRYNMFNDQLKQFHGSKARLDMGREWYEVYPESSAVDMKPSATKRLPGSFEPASRAHMRNFLDCVRSRKEPTAPVEAGQATNVTLCMAMEAQKTGRRVRFNPATKKMEV